MKFKDYLTEATAEESKGGKSLEAALNSAGITKVTKGKGSSDQYHVKANVGDDPFLFFKRLGLKISPSKLSLSSKYETYFVQGSDWEINFVNQLQTKGIFNTKALTPEKIGVAGLTLTKRELLKIMNQGVDNLGLPVNLNKNIKMLNDEVYKMKRAKIKIPEMNFTPSDLKTISKDYGEMLAGMWICNNGFSKVEFPAESNYPLVDFFAYKGNMKVPFSVKSGPGSFASINNIIDELNKIMPELNKTEKFLAQILLDIATKPLESGPFEVAKSLNSPGYKALCKGFGVKTLNSSDVVIELFKNMTPEQIKTNFSDLFELGSTPTQKSIEKLSKMSPSKKAGLILSPLVQSIINDLNSGNNKKVLSKIANRMDIVQINIDVTKNSVEVKTKNFKDSKFKFGWGGGATTYTRVRIGFKIE